MGRKKRQERSFDWRLGGKTLYEATKPMKPVNRMAGIVTSHTGSSQTAAETMMGNLYSIPKVMKELFAATTETENSIGPESAEINRRNRQTRQICYDKLKAIHDDNNLRKYRDIIRSQLREFVANRPTPLPGDFVNFLRNCNYFVFIVTLQPKPHITRSN